METPGIVFPSGYDTPIAEGAEHNDFYYEIDRQRLWRFDEYDSQWHDLGAAGPNVAVLFGTSVPVGIGNDLDFFNRYSNGEVYQKIGSTWRLMGSNQYGLPLGADALTFTDISDPNKPISASLGLVLVDGFSPILATDQGLAVKKDISAGGFVSSNQGEVWIGHGRNDCQDVPKIILSHADSNVYGTDANGHPYETLYIRKAVGTTVTNSGNVDLGDLTSHGAIYTNSIKHLDGSDWNFGSGSWNGGTVTTPINIAYPNPYIVLLDTEAISYATVNAGIQFKNSYAYVGQVSQEGETLLLGSFGGSGKIVFKTASSDKMTLNTAGQLQMATQGSTGGLLIGGDVHVYRSAANVLYTPDAITCGSGLTLVTANDYWQIQFGYGKIGVQNWDLTFNTEYNMDMSWTFGGVEKMNLSRVGNLVIQGTFIDIGDDTTARIRSDAAYIGFFRRDNSAEPIRAKSLLVSTSYSYSAPDDGIGFGGDCNLYRAAANILKTDDSLEIAGRLNGDSYGYINLENGIKFHYATTYIVGTSIGGNACIDFAGGDVCIEGNLTVGRTTGGLSVTGIIGLTGDLSNNCYIQYGTGTGAMRLAKTNTGVLSIQSWSGSSWQLATTNTSNLFVDHINSASGQGIYIMDTLKPYSSSINISGRVDSDSVIHGGGGSGDAFLVGDDCYFVDINNANRIGIQGSTDRSQAGFQFGSGGMWLYRDSNYLRCSSGFVADGTVTVGTYASGGTGSAAYFNLSHQLCQGTSLKAYKTNIETLSDASWIYNLRPITFDWKDHKDKQAFGRQIGLIAEEVQPYAPLLTFNDDQTGELRGILYEKLAVPMLVELQKLRREVNELKAKIAAA